MFAVSLLLAVAVAAWLIVRSANAGVVQKPVQPIPKRQLGRVCAAANTVLVGALWFKTSYADV